MLAVHVFKQDKPVMTGLGYWLIYSVHKEKRQTNITTGNLPLQDALYCLQQLLVYWASLQRYPNIYRGLQRYPKFSNELHNWCTGALEWKGT